MNNTWTHDYFADPAHYLKSITGPRGNVLQEVQYNEDGRFVGLVDALGNVIEQQHDIENNTFTSTDALGNATQYAYDNRGNITELIDAKGNSAKFEYGDPRNPRLETSITDPNGNITRFQYDARGNVTLLEEPGGIFTQFQYDSFNNIVRTVGPATTIPGDGYADTLIDSSFADDMVVGTTIRQRLADLNSGIEFVTTGVDSADIILGVEYDPDFQTPQDSDYLLLADGDYVTVGFDEQVTDRDGDDLFIVTPLFSGEFSSGGERAIVSITTDGTNFVNVAEIESAPIIGIDLAESGIAGDILGVRITGQFTDDGNPLNDRFALTGIQVTLGEFTTTRSLYDQSGNLLSFTNAEGETEQFTRDNFGRPTSYTDAVGNETTFEYSKFNDPDKTIFTDGSFTLREKDSRGLLVSFTTEVGAESTIEYDASGRSTHTIDSLGRVNETVFDDDLLVKVIDPLGRETNFEYDDKNRLIKTVDPIGGETDRTYDANNQLLTVTNPEGQVTRWAYNSIGENTSITDAKDRTTYYEYDGNSNLTAVTDTLGARTEYQYDNQNRLVVEIDALGNDDLYFYDERDDLVAVTDRNGNTFAYEYDNVRRLVKSIDSVGGEQEWTYDEAGNLTQVEDELGNITEYQYDNRNRQISSKDASGYTQASEYDVSGRLVRQVDRDGNISEYRYNSGNQLIETIDPLLGIRSYQYDDYGNTTVVTDELGRTETTREYDDLNRVSSSTDARNAVTRYEYDGVGNLLSLTDAEGNRTSYLYDLTNNVVRETDPLGNFSTFQYNEVDEVTVSVDRLGRITEYEYDTLYRTVSETWKSASGVVQQQHQFTYDANDNLLTASGPNNSFEFAYDELDRLIRDTSISAERPTVVLEYSYDAYGNKINTQDNYGVSASAAFDARNLLSSIGWSGGGITGAQISYSRNGSGQVSAIDRYSDLAGTNLIGKSNFVFDALRRSTNTTHLNGVGDLLAQYDRTFDAAGQLVEQGINGVISSYAFDDTSQLVAAEVENGLNEAYEYDLNGNRIGGANNVDANNQLLADGEFSYEYDAEGNLTRKTSVETGGYTLYTFDHRNRMTSGVAYSSSGVVVSDSQFTYDLFDRLISREIDRDGDGPLVATVNHTVYDGENAWADFDDNGNVEARYLFGEALDSNIARWRPSEGVAWYLTDHLGSVRDIVDNTGTVINHVEYDSFGNILFETNASAGDRYKYTGREWQQELGLYYYRARFYDPANGRFVSQDPIGFEGGDTNLQRYVANNPLSFTDPSGNHAETATLQTRIAVPLTQWKGSCFTIQFLENAVTSVGVKLVFTTFGGQNQTQTPADVGQQLLETAAGLAFDAAFAAVSCATLGASRVATGTFALVATRLAVVAPAASVTASAAAAAGIEIFSEGVTFAFSKSSGEDSCNFGRNNKSRNRGRGANSKDRKQVDAVARRAGVDRNEFGKFVEETKHLEGRCGADNFSFQQLLDLAEEFKALFGG